MRTVLIAVVLLGGAAAATAQSSDPTAFSESLVVTASLEPAAREDLSAAVTVVAQDEIAARQATSVAEVLATVPGMTVLRSGSPGKATSLFSRGTESDHTLVLWNGVKLNNPFFGGFDWAFLPTDGVERVEIVRGPFSAVHGSEAVGGVVQIVSAAEPGGRLALEGGANAYRRGSLVAGLARGRFDFDITGSVRRGDGLVENDFFSADDLAVHGGWKASDRLTLSLVARTNDAHNGIPLSAGRRSPQRQIEWQERQIAMPIAVTRGRWSVKARVSQVEYEQRFSDPEDVFGFTASSTDSRSNRGRFEAARHFEGGSWLAVGAEIEELEVNDRSVFGLNLEAARQRTRSLFVQSARDFARAHLDLGVRLDDNDAFGAKASPRVGVVVSLGPSTRMRAAWGSGFRAPSLGRASIRSPATRSWHRRRAAAGSWESAMSTAGGASTSPRSIRD